jgi:uncharacterized protein
MFGALLLAALISPLGHVTDTAGMLSPAAIVELETTLRSFEEETGAEIAVATIPSLGASHTIETYAAELFQEWGIGKEKEDNGILLLIARDDREMRIEVGYGLEGAVPDIEAGRIISEVLVPAFQAGDYDRGVAAAVARLADDIRNGAPPAASRGALPENPAQFLPFIFFFFIFLSSVLARSKSWWAGGVVGAVLGLLFFSSLLWTVALVAAGLAFDYLVSKTYRRHKASGTAPPWWIGGPPRGGRGGGFGGFGGGSSGGGGASGHW